MSAELKSALLAEASKGAVKGTVATEASSHVEANAGTQTEVGHAGAAEHSDAGGLPPFLRFDPGVWIWTMLVFVTMLLLLKKLAWKPILASIDEREKTIKNSLEQAAHIQEEAKRISAEQSKIMAEARAEANALLQSAKQSSEELRRKLEQIAQEEKARIIASATQEIEASKRAAISELRKTTADLSILIAEKLIQSNLDDAKQRALVDQLINEVSVKGI